MGIIRPIIFDSKDVALNILSDMKDKEEEFNKLYDETEDENMSVYEFNSKLNRMIQLTTEMTNLLSELEKTNKNK